ncbi:MAG TPA: electron transfer flavoprotein-ubiquinone oxidoreductase [Methylovirgula sp.]|nr:electron transfer flavoprotein-ubiquinone oxidoreductase [Methylovirgula sp.]
MAAADKPPRESIDFDVVIVGAGPAGLAAAIRLKQRDPGLAVVVIEKGAELGGHILSGAVIDPIGLDRLLPEWRSAGDCPLKTPVSEEHFYYLGPAGALSFPTALLPKPMRNRGAFVGSLGALVRWLGAKAESLGVEIYPGFAAAEPLYDAKGAVAGVATGDMGIGRDGHRKETFSRGMELHGKYVLIAEGARGSLAKELIAKFELDRDRAPQKFGIGLKELWSIPGAKHRPGRVEHFLGWPLDDHTGGGGFLYHYGDGLISIGFVVHLDYANPTLSPFDEFQRFKTHPQIMPLLVGAERLAFGARAITEGGFQSVPKLCFPGGALIGCAAGFVNVPRIKGSHNAILSGMLAADHVADAIAEGRAHDELIAYEDGWRASDIGRDLYRARNVKPLLSKHGTLKGSALAGFDLWTQAVFGRSPFGTLTHDKPDHTTLTPLAKVTPLVYPKPDGKVSFDRLSSVFVSNTAHEEDQPVHLHLRDPSIPITQNLPLYGEPARLYCPAGVYEVVYENETAKTDPRFVINAANCVHCKTCDIKDPAQNIDWTPPEGGGGPNYRDM